MLWKHSWNPSNLQLVFLWIKCYHVSVEEEGRNLSAEEDQFVSEIMKYCEAIKQYKQDVKVLFHYIWYLKFYDPSN